MSQYQYYEFLAVDRPLEERWSAEDRALSTRAGGQADLHPGSRDDAAHTMKTLEVKVGCDGFHSIASV